jgi:lysine/ornithine N-monooxygenase
MTSSTNVAVIGVGPNGLSVAAHLRQAGVEFRAFGRPMGAWRFNMPAGMRLKSEPYASDLSAPNPGFLARDYCDQAGEVYPERVNPLSREQFINYGTWFADELVPDIDETEVVSLSRVPSGGFLIRTANEETLKADKVVVATGIIPFAYVPPELSGLPPDQISHSSAHSSLEHFRGKEVLIVGGGSSALETAALLLEQGASVKMIVRDNSVSWPAPNPTSPTRLQQFRRPVVRLCEGWTCWAYDRLPDVFRHLPKDMRVEKSLGFLGPAGAWWLRERVEGKVPMLFSHQVRGSSASGDRVQLQLSSPTGAQVTETADHVIAGTGFRFDLTRLDYLTPSLREDLKVMAGAPVLDHHLESNVSGLFFTGALAAPSLGPLMRFVAGTHFTAPRVMRRLGSKKAVRPRPASREHLSPKPRSQGGQEEEAAVGSSGGLV